METINTDNGIFQLADAFVNQTGCNIFLTGKAGTGKTTFLQHTKETTAKKSVVVAPTGVAAINAGGMTIHSFFQLPIGTFVPLTRLNNFPDQSRAIYSHGDLLRKIHINSQKRKLIQQLELLIIDEVSMVRADVMDAVDAVLRHIRKNHRQPFGGVQVLMIGDLYQLPPVVPEEEKPLLAEYYENAYFFSAKVFQKASMVNLVLDKIYRQSNEKFISLLNKIRHNTMKDEDLNLLNSYFRSDFIPPPGENYITLCSHHYKANAINEQELAKLPGETFEFPAVIEGDFNENAAPADRTLILKNGAQIMFIRNDKGEEKRYFNGKIGIISNINKQEIWIKFPGEEGEYLLEKEEWENIRYSLDDSTGRIIEKELGTFTQYPIRLAWAITIHKSQGLTFERAVIDAGDSFTSGQAYVAFSRLKSLKGLILRTRIREDSIISDKVINEKLHSADIDKLGILLLVEQKKYMYTLLYKSLNWKILDDAFQDFIEHYREKKVTYRDEALKFAGDCLTIIRELESISLKFEKELSKLLAAGEKAYDKMAERIGAASDYFMKRLKNEIDTRVQDHFNEVEKRPKMRKYLKSLHGLAFASFSKIQDFRQSGDLANGIAKGKNISVLLQSLNDQKKQTIFQAKDIPRTVKPKKGDSRKMSYEMYKKGKPVDEIARERMLTKGTIESHLLYYISEGLLDVSAIVTPKKYDIINSAIHKYNFDSVAELKYLLGDNYTYSEIRAVMKHLQASAHRNK